MEDIIFGSNIYKIGYMTYSSLLLKTYAKIICSSKMIPYRLCYKTNSDNLKFSNCCYFPFHELCYKDYENTECIICGKTGKLISKIHKFENLFCENEKYEEIMSQKDSIAKKIEEINEKRIKEILGKVSKEKMEAILNDLNNSK